ncbi:MAG: homoserine kinase [Alphaproteobacteria bacterium]|nr:homoserine kinase [Alphaproteobacteria bacterium]
MAVYTPVDEAQLERFLRQYAIGELVSVKGIAEGVENSNYLLQTTKGGYILTLYEKRVHARDLPFFLGLMQHLAGRGLACPLPVKGRDGQALRRLAGRPAAVIGFLAGVSVMRPRISHCAAVGQALAQLHLAGAEFSLRRVNALSVAGWKKLYASCRRRADTVWDGLQAELDMELREIARRWPKDLPQGVIHADLFPDNVFFRGEQLTGLIDFYFACNDLLAYDIAVCLNAWCFEPDGGFNATKGRALLSAYRKTRPLSVAELAALPLLARGAALRFLLTRLYDWLNQVPGALVRPKDPLEYLHKLRFHRGLSGPEAYGLT